MEDSKAYISRLLTEKLTGIIDADDAAIIDKLIETEPDVRAQWEQMQAKISAAVEAKHFNLDNAAEAWLRLQPVTVRKKRYYRIIAMAAAACLAGLAVLGYVFSHPAEKTSRNDFFARAKQWPDDSIVMQTEQGDIVNLTTAQNQEVMVGEARLSLTDSSMLVHSTKADVSGWQTLLVPDMLTYKVTLVDGSVIKLNSGTRIQFPLEFAVGKREVYIEGEAFFDIAHDAQSPFIVHTAKSDIQVLGTSFNINTYEPGQARTSLVSGSVRATSAKGNTVLQPGQEVVFTDSSFTTYSFDVAATLSWLEGAYYFHEVPLQNLSGILSRWFKTRVQFDKPELENKMFSGALLKNQPLQVFLENLELSDNIHSTLKDGVVHFQ
ncbi:FecR family protein [Filimonas lacunae]|uniref:FecR family protein n=1 Tax=Filimonas lacunae TaxID=477680 RepID=A0A173MD19_9BACT|nr:FecR family protein [Filimonas lacunae]BAV05455.1 anti-sigma factor [Filimonas lacunae]SIT21032.1 FecR family protein [Filimonas lacunae]